MILESVVLAVVATASPSSSALGITSQVRSSATARTGAIFSLARGEAYFQALASRRVWSSEDSETLRTQPFPSPKAALEHPMPRNSTPRPRAHLL